MTFTFRLLTHSSTEFPEILKQIPDAPERLYVAGTDLSEIINHPRVTIVGSRAASPYGQAVASQIGRDLARAGIIIISGLAIGMDSLAHAAAVEVGTPTLAVLPCGPDRVYPSRHQQLAERIIKQGGAIVTEYPPNTRIYPSNFIERNRIAAGLGDALVIVEAAERSGTLSTARFALEQGREVFAVPGNITSATSKGTNNLIRTGANPLLSAEDIFNFFGIQPNTQKSKPRSKNPQEQLLIDLIMQGTSDGNELLNASQMDIRTFNQALTMLEISGIVRALGNNQWALN